MQPPHVAQLLRISSPMHLKMRNECECFNSSLNPPIQDNDMPTSYAGIQIFASSWREIILAQNEANDALLPLWIKPSCHPRYSRSWHCPNTGIARSGHPDRPHLTVHAIPRGHVRFRCAQGSQRHLFRDPCCARRKAGSSACQSPLEAPWQSTPRRSAQGASRATNSNAPFDQ